jgi:2,3-bisphosphoglycerate-independent phosphoglycerate mutase
MLWLLEMGWLTYPSKNWMVKHPSKAHTPNMDFIAKNGSCGMLKTAQRE